MRECRILCPSIPFCVLVRLYGRVEIHRPEEGCYDVVDSALVAVWVDWSAILRIVLRPDLVKKSLSD